MISGLVNFATRATLELLANKLMSRAGGINSEAYYTKGWQFNNLFKLQELPLQ
jgi:hypothetical protein